MYEQILKFGAEIVRSLRGARAPVLVYIPPGAELRGGAWAVVDPSVHSARMEMYADNDARGGAWAVVDPSVHSARMEMYADNDASCNLITAEAKIRELEAELLAAETARKTREKELSPIYREVAVHFAELHDTAERMLEKGCIFDIIPWRESRRLLHWRLKRLLLQNEQERLVQRACEPAGMDQGAAAATLRRWFTEDMGETQNPHQNRSTRFGATSPQSYPAKESLISYRSIRFGSTSPQRTRFQIGSSVSELHTKVSEYLKRLLVQSEQERLVQRISSSRTNGSTTTRRCEVWELQRGKRVRVRVLNRNLRAIRADHVLNTVNELVMELTPSQRSEFIRKLSALDM
uniref:Acetyl CoA Carboxylase-6 n=1 Tax=Plutella xylostella TaxID=51655 RepID=A0A1L8D6E8_PLUXY